MNTPIRMACLVLALAPAFAVAAEKSYMTLVGDLLAATESPRMIREYCAKRAPVTDALNTRMYEIWAMRHKDLLGAVAEQLARANVRLKNQGAPGGDRPIDSMRKIASERLEQALLGTTQAEVERYCGGYPQLIEKKDKEAETSIRQLLSVVEYADRMLTEQERT